MTDFAATWLGGVGGGVAGFVLARAVGPRLARETVAGTPDAWISLALILLGMIMVASGIGTWVVLRLRGHDRAPLTAVLFPILTVVISGALFALGGAALPFLHGDVEDFALFAGGTAATLAGAVLSRLLATGGVRG